jgi:hypothetical protein
VSCSIALTELVDLSPIALAAMAGVWFTVRNWKFIRR